MTARSFTLADPASLDDLQTFLARAQRVEDGSVRLIGGSGVLAVYAAVLYPVGLLDETPTVLGLRTLALTSRGDSPRAPTVGQDGGHLRDVGLCVRGLSPRLVSGGGCLRYSFGQSGKAISIEPLRQDS